MESDRGRLHDRHDAFDGACHVLYSMTPDGTDRVMIPTGSVVDPVDPSWSPDGSSIAFSARAGEDWFVYTMALDGSEPVRLAADLPSLRPTQPAWSPDGATIAFVRGRGGPGANDPGRERVAFHPVVDATGRLGAAATLRRLLHDRWRRVRGPGSRVVARRYPDPGHAGHGRGAQLIDPDNGRSSRSPRGSRPDRSPGSPFPLAPHPTRVRSHSRSTPTT